MKVKNPNALVGLGGGIGGGQIVINLAHLFGWNVSAGWAITIAGAATYVILFVGREGLAGVWHLIVHGTSKPAPVAPVAAVPLPADPPKPPTVV